MCDLIRQERRRDAKRRKLEREMDRMVNTLRHQLAPPEPIDVSAQCVSPSAVPEEEGAVSETKRRRKKAKKSRQALLEPIDVSAQCVSPSAVPEDSMSQQPETTREVLSPDNRQRAIVFENGQWMRLHADVPSSVLPPVRRTAEDNKSSMR